MKLPALFVRKAAVPAASASASPARIFISRLMGGTKKTVTTYDNAVAAVKAMQHPIIFRCLNKLGLTVQSVSWYVTDDTDGATATEIGQSKATHRAALSKVLNKPNPAMSGSQLRYFATLSWACYGKMAFKVSVHTDGRINAIYPLGIAFLRASFDRYGSVSEFEYGQTGNSIKMKSPSSVLRNEQGVPIEEFAFMITKPSLDGALDMEKHNTPLQSVGLPKAIYDALMQRALETADGAPNSTWLVTADRDLDADQADAVKEGIENTKPGQDEAGGVIFVAGTNLKVTELKNDLSDIHSKVPADDMTRTMYGAFGIPLALANLGGADGAKFANNFDESRKAFFEDTIDPEYLTPIEEGFTHALCQPGYRIRFDRDTIPALRKIRAEIAAIYEKVTFLSEDEKREATGWPKSKKEATADV